MYQPLTLKGQVVYTFDIIEMAVRIREVEVVACLVPSLRRRAHLSRSKMGKIAPPGIGH